MVRLVFHVPHGFAFLGSQLVSALFTRDLHPFLAPSRSREVGHCTAFEPRDFLVDPQEAFHSVHKLPLGGLGRGCFL